MTVKVEQRGEKWVVLRNGKVVEECDTNAQAWRRADRLSNEAINRQEDVANWIFNNAHPSGK